MRASFFLLLSTSACQAAFPITVDPDADDMATDGARDATDAFVSDNYIPPPPPEAGIWCGTSGSGDAGAYCQGTCCVKIGNGYAFSCRATPNDPCTGYNYAFSCDRTTDCPLNQYCCYTEMGSIEAGTYFAESHCGTCLQMESMCLTGATDDCPEQTACHPWFSTYGQCY